MSKAKTISKNEILKGTSISEWEFKAGPHTELLNSSLHK